MQLHETHGCVKPYCRSSFFLELQGSTATDFVFYMAVKVKGQTFMCRVCMCLHTYMWYMFMRACTAHL